MKYFSNYDNEVSEEVNIYERKNQDSNRNKPINKMSLTVDVTDTYIGIYKEETTNKYGVPKFLYRVGLFKKGRVLDTQNKGPSVLHEVQIYEDLLSKNKAALFTYGNKHDITTALDYVSDTMRPYQPISPSYNVRNHSLNMDRLRDEYSTDLYFSASICGEGLVSYEKFAPHQKGEVPLKDVLETLMKFNEMLIKEPKNSELATSKCQEQILVGLKSSAKYLQDQRNIPNNNDLSNISEELNTIKHR